MELRGAYEPQEICGSGTEAEVWHARRTADGGDVAVKIHRPGMPVDLALLEHLDNDQFRRHVPQLHGFGYVPTAYGQVGWVAMEYLPTTLAGLIAAEHAPGGPVPTQRAAELVAELARTLRFWQDPDGLDRTPIDVKPDNFGVRQARPAQLVVIDFGGVVRQTVTQRVGDVAAAQAYMSPEGIIGERHRASPWWSLGVIAYELATGSTRFRGADGRLLPDRVLLRETTLAEVDLSDVPDERWRLLLSGLLTRHPDDRWTGEEVAAWLAGDSPAVIRSAAPAAVTRAHAPITFQGLPYWKPADLAAQMLDQADLAARWLLTGATELRRWIREDVADNLFDTGYLTAISAAKPASAPLAVLAFGAVYAPQVTPLYRGHRVDAAGLSTLCAAGHTSNEILRELFGADVLPVAAQYRCQHPGCGTGDRCRILSRAADEVPRIVRGVEQLTAAVQAAPDPGSGQAGSWSAALSSPERDLALATAAQLTLQLDDPGGGARDPVRPGPLGFSAPGWWRRLAAQAAHADQESEAGRTTLTAAVTLRTRALNQRNQLRQGSWDRIRGLLAAARRVPSIALITVAALVLLNWSAAVGAFAIIAKDGQLMSTSPPQTALDHALGISAAASVFAILPVILAVALISALPRFGRRVLVPGVIGVTALGFAAPRMPPFPVAIIPQVVASWLARGGGAWHQLTGDAAVLICPIVALACLAAAGRIRRQRDGTRPAAGRPLRLPPGLQRPVAGLISFVVLEALLWAAVVIRMTVSGPVETGVTVGAAAASYQSGLLPACAAIAVLAAVLRPAAGYRVLVIGALAVAAVGIWSGPLPAINAIWHPEAASELASLAAIWGRATFWAAVVLAIPAALTGLQLAANQRAVGRR
jgi:Protein kinase domain